MRPEPETRPIPGWHQEDEKLVRNRVARPPSNVAPYHIRLANWLVSFTMIATCGTVLLFDAWIAYLILAHW